MGNQKRICVYHVLTIFFMPKQNYTQKKPREPDLIIKYSIIICQSVEVK